MPLKFFSYDDGLVWLEHNCQEIRGRSNCSHGEYIEEKKL